jgi:hypothetical protein
MFGEKIEEIEERLSLGGDSDVEPHASTSGYGLFTRSESC